MKFGLYIFLVFLFLIDKDPLKGQTSSHQIGIQYGMGTQSIFPFNSGSYTYNVGYLKANMAFLLNHNHKWSWYWNIGPGFFKARHQLINQWYKLDERDQEYAEKIPVFRKEKIIREYVLHIGMLIQYDLTDHLCLTGKAGVGPMFSDTETERLAKGLAFSDFLGFGIQYRVKSFMTGISCSVRHVSNANLLFPNNGHNSANIELSIGWIFSDRSG